MTTNSVLTQSLRHALAVVFLAARTVLYRVLRMIGKPVPWTFVALMYHSVPAEEVSSFSAQMEFLKTHTSLVGADLRPENAAAGQRYVAITFDDGFESYSRNVMPVMREKRIPSTVFVVSGYLGKTAGWVRVEGRERAEQELMVEDELKALLEEGLIAVGSHSVHHHALTSSRLSLEEIRFELKHSKEDLERKLGRPVSLFALPYGAFDARVLSLADEAGYTRVFLSVPLGSLSNIDGRLAGRIEVSSSEPLGSFRLKALGGYQYLPMAIAIKGRVLGWARRICGRVPVKDD